MSELNGIFVSKSYPFFTFGDKTGKKILMYYFINKKVKQHLSEAMGRQWSILAERSEHLSYYLPRRNFVACFIHTTGHGYLQAHLDWIGSAENYFWAFCRTGDITEQVTNSQYWHGIRKNKYIHFTLYDLFFKDQSYVWHYLRHFSYIK